MTDPPSPPLTSLTVDLPVKPYTILIGTGLLADTGQYLHSLLGTKYCTILTDNNVSPLYLSTLQNSLISAGHTLNTPIVVKAGEKTKDFSVLQDIVEKLVSSPIDRSSVLLVLGGGVVGDVGGFAASITLRGISLIQIPTTLLAQVDSAVGGKTGINTPVGKNLIGTFYHPRLVLTDLNTLKTLPFPHIRAGYAEILKYALIQDKEFFTWLEEKVSDLLLCNPQTLCYAIRKSCQIKSGIVSVDEHEHNIRALLNLGHTFAHAFETFTGYTSDFLHGEAVGLGICLAFQLSHRLGLISREQVLRVVDHLKIVGLPTTPKDLPIPIHSDHVNDLLSLMRRDKKNIDAQITLILVKSIGNAFIQYNVETNVLEHFLSDWIKGDSFLT